MIWWLLLAIVVALGVATLVANARQSELARMRSVVRRREVAEQDGTARALLQHPVIDLSRCLGCATCVAVCPEGDVLEIVHGQAMVVKGARCRGIAACERECPVDAIQVTIADLRERDDVPAIEGSLEAVGVPGLFLAGEVTVHALIKTAIEHGTHVAREVARRAEPNDAQDEAWDLVIVGAGPAGIACALEAKRLGVRAVVLEQEDSAGGTVTKYPRKKLILNEPVELPLYGRLGRDRYSKEELVAIWDELVQRHGLDVRVGAAVDRVESVAGPSAGRFVVACGETSFAAHNVCLALGRRGSPNKLGVPGETSERVSYSLIDARSYAGRRTLVVGGGDAALEAALALAEQDGTQVTLSYRRAEVFRASAKNLARFHAATEGGRIEALMESEVLDIDAERVRLRKGDATLELAIDDVFVLAGGQASFDLLHQAGVSFDPEHQQPPELVGEQGTGLLRALRVGMALALAAVVWVAWNADYYALDALSRPSHPRHDLLRSGRGVGLWSGVLAVALVALNLLYLVRRNTRIGRWLGSLKLWMTSHVATGILALLFAVVHSAMQPKNTSGGHSLWIMGALVLTGVVGRYVYSYLPRAANGSELDLAEYKAQLGRTSDEWEQGHRIFRAKVRSEVEALIDEKRWTGSLPKRLFALFGWQRDLSRVLARLAREGRDDGVTEFQIKETVRLARRAHRSALVTSHYEDLRALLNTWRYLHRWGALLLVLLVAVHVAYALSYGSFVGAAG